MIPLITLGVSLGGGVLGSWLLAHLVNDGVGLGLQLNGGRGVLEKGPARVRPRPPLAPTTVVDGNCYSAPFTFGAVTITFRPYLSFKDFALLPRNVYVFLNCLLFREVCTILEKHTCSRSVYFSENIVFF